MPGDDLESILDSLVAADQQDPAERGDRSSLTALLVHCSFHQVDRKGDLWPVESDWQIIDLESPGTQIRTSSDEGYVVDGSLRHHVTQYDIDAVLVLGHTACNVVADAYRHHATETFEQPQGVEGHLQPLISLIEDAESAGHIDTSAGVRQAQYQLVEYSVVRQVEILREHLRPSIAVAGYVHDQDGVYDNSPGTPYLVAVGDVTEPDRVVRLLPETERTAVDSLRS